MGTRLRGIFSFLGKRISPFDPQEKGIRLAVWSSNNLYASGMKTPARGKAALALRYDLPLLLLSAAAQPLAALTPYGCGTPLAGDALPILQKCAVIPVYRGAHQCGERSNAAFGKQSAAEQTSLAPHDSKARLRVVTTRRDSWRSHVHRTYIAQRVQLFEIETANVKRLSFGRATPVFFLGKENGGRITRHMCRIPLRTCAKKHPRPHGRKK